MSQIVRRQAARQDLADIFYHDIREGSPATARRFRVQAEAAFQRLASMPNLGARYDHEHPALAGLRFLPLPSRFKKFVVFYRPVADGIEIVRVLHGARDIESVLADEFGLEDGEDVEAADDEAE
jgi:toxin ParE1/3/4